MSTMIFLYADRAVQLAPQQRVWSSYPKEEGMEGGSVCNRLEEEDRHCVGVRDAAALSQQTSVDEKCRTYLMSCIDSLWNDTFSYSNVYTLQTTPMPYSLLYKNHG
jgi:hypothetical protein